MDSCWCLLSATSAQNTMHFHQLHMLYSYDICHGIRINTHAHDLKPFVWTTDATATAFP
jgi:hypothetical protein